MAQHKRIKHFHEPGHLHEFTFSCYRRLPLLSDSSLLEPLARSIDAAGEAEHFELVAFVLMPDHVHLLSYPREASADFGRYLARIKQPFSKLVKERWTAQGSPLLESLMIRERPGKVCFRFWQEGAGYDRNLYSPAAIIAAIDYIHNNPVRRGLCSLATQWEWSSARYYLLEPLQQQFAGLPRVTAPPTEAVK